MKILFRVLTLLLITSTGLVVAGAAVAQEEEFHAAPYLGVAFAIGVEQFDGEGAEGFSSVDEAFGVDVWVGMRSSRYVGIELQVMYLKGFDTKFDTDVIGIGLGKVKLDAEFLATTVNFKFYPWEGRFQPYAVVGVGGGRLEIKLLGESFDESDVIFRLGAGLDFNIAGPFDAVAGWSYIFTSGDIKDTDIIEIKLGVQYQF